MENKVDWDRMGRAVDKFVFTYQRGPTFKIPDAIGKIREYYEEPQESPLGKKICGRLDELRSTALSPIGRLEINKAVKDIVEFPEVTHQMAEDFNTTANDDINKIALGQLRQYCKKGKYDTKET